MDGSRSLPSVVLRVLLRSTLCACLGAAHDLGVSVTSADRTSGFIYGTTPNDSVTVRVLTQADGRVRVEFNVKSPAGNDTDLANRLHRAYEARMGR